MCGICGFVGAQPPPTRKLLASLNIKRGQDGSGMLYNTSTTKWNPRFNKTKKDIIEALGDKEFQDHIFHAPLLLVHTRAASRTTSIGTSADDTAHPFQIGNVVLAHNGIINNWEELQRQLRREHPELHRERLFKVDSECIAASLSVETPDANGYREAFGRLQGVAAVWFTDARKPNSFFIWTWNKELHYYLASDNSEFVFSSDKAHLRAAGYPKKKIRAFDRGGTLFEIGVFPKISMRRIGTFPAKKYESNGGVRVYGHRGYEDDFLTPSRWGELAARNVHIRLITEGTESGPASRSNKFEYRQTADLDVTPVLGVSSEEEAATVAEKDFEQFTLKNVPHAEALSQATHVVQLLDDLKTGETQYCTKCKRCICSFELLFTMREAETAANEPRAWSHSNVCVHCNTEGSLRQLTQEEAGRRFETLVSRLPTDSTSYLWEYWEVENKEAALAAIMDGYEDALSTEQGATEDPETTEEADATVILPADDGEEERLLAAGTP